MFFHLHTHSYFSLLEGTASPEQLVERAAQHGMPALALTDHDRLTGAIAFYDACQGAGIQPILGLEIGVILPLDEFQRESANLVLLATGMAGWGSLCRLSSALLCEENDSAGAIPFDTLAENSQGLLCLTGEGGWLSRLIRSRQQETALQSLTLLHEIFPRRTYVELQAVRCNLPNLVGLASLAGRAGLPSVATGNVYCLNPEEAHRQRLLSAIRLNCTLAELPPDSAAPEGAYFTSPEEMVQHFSHFPAALEALDEIRAHCRLELPLGQQHYPTIELPDGMTPIQVLRQKALSGASERYGEITSAIQGRLDHELSVIEDSGYASLFLIMEEIIAFVIEADIPYSSRGSAASSLVAHCLGITSPDPLRLNLYFERFLNPARHTPPDIDTDLCSKRRDRVIQYVYARYGEDRVAMVSTINRLRSRSALRETAKAHGFSQDEISRLVKGLPGRGWGPPQRRHSGDKDGFDALRERFPSSRYQKIIQDAQSILGLPDHLSVHPGGVVIAPGTLNDLAPTQLAGKHIRITQFDLEQVERLGLVKIDLLGTRGLSVLGDVAEAMLKMRHEEGNGQESKIVDNKLRVANCSNSQKINLLDNIQYTDTDTTSLIQSTRTTGCFAIESPGMQRTLKEIEADSLDDIMIALALYRPGPMTGGLKDAFVNRHLGKEQVEHLHPALTSLLEETYGVILYQEQVLRIAHELAGFSLSEADLLRRAMSHFDPGDRMKTLKEKFVQGAEELSGVPPETGERIWELMAAFAGYGFPKAHSASYAQIAWKSAYCKAHYPAEFLAAVLANWGGYYSQEVYLLEARRLGLQVRGPHINHSQRQFSAIPIDDSKVLFMGLDQVRELTHQTQRHILQERPFHTLEEFMIRVHPRPKETEHLVKVGALEGLGTIPSILRQLRQKTWKAGQMALFAPATEENGEEQDWGLEKKASAQRELLGTSLIAHPLELIQDQLEQANVLPIIEARQQLGKTVRIAGIRHRWRRARRKRGNTVYHTVLDDLSDGMRILVMEDIYHKHRELFSSRKPLIVQGLVNHDMQVEETVLVVHKVWGK